MPSAFQRALAVGVVLVLGIIAGSFPASATCGGGGGGGLGGTTAGGSDAAEVYHVPWKILRPGATAPEGTLAVFWFPTSPENARGSDLLISRYLTLTSEQCVSMGLVTSDNSTLRAKYTASPDQP